MNVSYFRNSKWNFLRKIFRVNVAEQTFYIEKKKECECAAWSRLVMNVVYIIILRLTSVHVYSCKVLHILM